MKHSYFEIRNFKGITHVRLDLNTPPRGRVHTLVGLNESGKTTILQAIHSLRYNAENLNPLNLHGYTISDIHDLIPISKRSNFNEEITVTAAYQPEPDDQKLIRDFLREKLRFELTEDIRPFTITQATAFVASELAPTQPKPTWSVEFIGKKKGAKKSRELVDDEWQTAISFVRTLLPSVLYFPNFLFELPDKIYLEDELLDKEKQEQHEYYRHVLQDVLNAIGDKTTIEKHILERAKSAKSHDRNALEAVVLNMGSEITARVFGAWNRIFKRPIGNKEIVVDCDYDAIGGWYLRLRLKDANEIYKISERSLGFSWFFVFLLLTQYRGYRGDVAKDVLFLFDEPASNLHSSAQKELLGSFGKFPANSAIIYTTHSHHMINPMWLEGTFVVRNEGLEYDSNELDYNAKKTLITAQKYREFASQHPNKATYFQPVLDVLDYSPGLLENVPDVVMVEGKHDFYTLKYFQDIVLKRSTILNLMPGGGAGSLDDMIRMYIAWGRNFTILLDSDKAGAKEKKRYEEMFGIFVKDRLFSLEDIEPAWKRTGMEYLLDDADRLAVQQAAYPSATSFHKTHFNRAIQELYLTGQVPALSNPTIANFKKVLEFCGEKIELMK